jgi:hypothetical protein
MRKRIYYSPQFTIDEAKPFNVVGSLLWISLSMT